MISGTRVAPRYMTHFDMRPWSPAISPWSLVYRTHVASDRRRASSASTIRPTASSMTLTFAQYARRIPSMASSFIVSVSDSHRKASSSRP